MYSKLLPPGSLSKAAIELSACSIESLLVECGSVLSTTTVSASDDIRAQPWTYQTQPTFKLFPDRIVDQGLLASTPANLTAGRGIVGHLH
jgi:hypothetical protein